MLPANTFRKRTLLPLLALTLPWTPALAGETYVGIDVAPVVYWQEPQVTCFYNCGSYSSEQDVYASGFGFHAGHWFWNLDGGKVGLEAGYTSLGHIRGSTTYIGGSLGPVSTGNWEYRATATYVALSMQGPIMKGQDILGRLGAFRSVATAEGTQVIGGAPYSTSSSEVGLLLGVGYLATLSGPLSFVANVDGYLNIQLPDPTAPTETVSRNILRLSIGMEYSF